MSDNFTLYLLLVAALAIGFLLGRRELRRRPKSTAMAPDEYFRGLNHLINERHDLAVVDTFVEAMVVSNDTVDTHLALGSLVRRRGEVDKAIRIHQGLLARPVITPSERARIELELARDYMGAGLLGRAENLLLQLAGKPGPEKPTAQQGLLEIYQREREWQQAVDVGRDIARQDRAVKAKLAHFQCELAEEALAEGDLRRARAELAKGNEFDPGCARVSLLGASVEIRAKRYRNVRRLLRRAVSQDPDCVPETLECFQEACEAMGDQAGYRAFLEDCLRLGPFLPVVTSLGAHLERTSGRAQASKFMMEHLLRNPTLGGFVALLEHLDRDGETLAPEQLALVRRFTQSLLHKQSAYRCRNCGFSSRSIMWQCPSCHEWGSIKPIVRREARTQG